MLKEMLMSNALLGESGGGGGGGSSDVSLATVTVTDASEDAGSAVYIGGCAWICPADEYEEEPLEVEEGTVAHGGETNDIQVVLYKGSASFYISAQSIVSATGNITDEGGGSFTITGDCAIQAIGYGD